MNKKATLPSFPFSNRLPHTCQQQQQRTYLNMSRNKSTLTSLRSNLQLSGLIKPRCDRSTRWIPADIAEHIAVFADPSDLAILTCTCTMWRDYITRTNTFWYRRYMRDFPIGTWWHVSLLQWQLECASVPGRLSSSTGGRSPKANSNFTVTEGSSSASINAMAKVRRGVGR